MVGQAAEGLGADDVLKACLLQLHHLGRQQPALTHLVADTDDSVRHFFRVQKQCGRMELGMLFNRRDHQLFPHGKPAHQRIGAELQQLAAAVQAHGLGHVGNTVLHKTHQARQVHLAVLAVEELLQIVIAQR